MPPCTNDDECFLQEVEQGQGGTVQRHHQCLNATCVPMEFRQKQHPTFDLLSAYSSHLTRPDKEALQQISNCLRTLHERLYDIWKAQTETRSLEAELGIPLASMAIILINQCAVNLTATIMNLPQTFAMRALFVSSCIGWTIYWKTLFQGLGTTAQYREHLLAPWSTITDLYSTFQSLLKLVALVRTVQSHPRGVVVTLRDDSPTSKEWVATRSRRGADRRSESDFDEDDAKESRETTVQQAVDSLVSILASGRLSPDADKIATAYVIPYYSTRNGNLYMYFRDRDRGMMCQASTALIASLLACMLPDEIFGASTIPGHIFVSWIHDGYYTPIETTVFNAQEYGHVGVSYTYTLPPARPVHNEPYVYLVSDDLDESSRTLYAIDCGENDGVLAGCSTFSSRFPFVDGKTVVCRGLPAIELRVVNNTVVSLVFPPTTTRVALLAFQKHYVLGYLKRGFGVLPQSYSCTVENNKTTLYLSARDPGLLDKIMEAMTLLVSQKHDEPIQLRMGLLRDPLVQTTKGISSSIMNNVVLGIIQTPSSGLVTVDMKSYMRHYKKPGRTWTRIKTMIATLKTLSINHSNDRDGSFLFKLAIDAPNAQQLTDDLDSLLLQETDGLSRASLKPLAAYTELLDDRVAIRPLRAQNLVAEKHSVSQILAFQWYSGISLMVVSDDVRALIETFEQTARKCISCLQKTIQDMRSVLMEHFEYLSDLSLDRRTSDRQDKRPRARETERQRETRTET